MTVAPVRRASWTASEPTPPAVPEMTTVSPCLGWTACTTPHAVVLELVRILMATLDAGAW